MTVLFMLVQVELIKQLRLLTYRAYLTQHQCSLSHPCEALPAHRALGELFMSIQYQNFNRLDNCWPLIGELN